MSAGGAAGGGAHTVGVVSGARAPGPVLVLVHVKRLAIAPSHRGYLSHP